MPRIITVDPTGAISRIVRSAIDLLDLSITQVDVPNGTDALEELARHADLVVSSFEPDENMKGFEFALRVKQKSQETGVLILGDIDDPDDLDEETAADSPFVYLSRPVDIHQFLRVFMAGLESHEAMNEALHASVSGGGGGITTVDMGPVPEIDLNAVQGIVDSLLTDLGAMAIMLVTRTGETLMERGAVGYIDREQLASAMAPVMQSNIDVSDLVGGQVATVQLYDGDEYDIFVLSVGLHHFVCVMFDGQMGAKQFGMVIRFGRRAVEDMIALIGADAFIISPPVKPEPARRSQPAKKQEPEPEEPIELARAEITIEEEAAPEPVEAAPQLDPIENLDADALFSDDFELEGDLFDLENLEDLSAAGDQSGSTLDWDQAVGLGIIPKS